MAPQSRSGAGSSGEDYIEDKDAKHVLDSIGKIVHDQVKEEAAGRSKGELTGLLSQASIWNESASSPNPCSPDYTERFDANSNRYPCGKDGTGKEHRFSKESGGECANSKIKDNYKGSNDKDVGACAPYRRLSLCNKNMEKMGRTSRTKLDLLADVCMAAKYEGESLNTYSAQYDLKYPGSGFTLCTMLARSFADIGDIVRGKDLYFGKKKKKQTERDQLESKLKEIFGDIYNELTSTNGVKERYTNDGGDFFQLREDWWEANRETVWKAMTCDAPPDAQYFRGTCGSNAKTAPQTPSQCRCDGSNADQVPTYFDYVPQYLRWFEEWAEDFCRKKKIKVENVKKQCRGPNGKDKYCSRNGCDCEQTVRAKGKLRYGNRCTDCLYACHRYENWIDNQRKQFDKQKKKYDDEIKKYKNGASGIRRQKRGAHGGSDHKGYEKIFYEKLEEQNYGTVEGFLGLLNKEEVCKKVQDDKEGGKIDFTEDADDENKKNEGTFYHSEYCQPCPYCGVKKKGDNWEPKEKDDNCKRGKLYEPNKDANPTPITILKSGENHDDIAKRLNEFCQEQNRSVGSSSGGGGSISEKKELIEEWQCYKHNEVHKVNNGEDDEDDYKNVEAAGGLCILENQKKKEEGKEKKSEKEPEQFQKTYNDFFYYWVAHMLKDSIHWKKKLEKCLQNGNKKCGKNCNNDCGCFEKWVVQKKTEWDKIKEQFSKQENIPGNCYFTTLEGVLKLEFLEEKSAQDTQNNVSAEEAKEIKQLSKIIESEDKNEDAAVAAGGCGTGDPKEQKTLMDKLIDYERGEAETCKKCQDTAPKAPALDLGRSAGTSPLAPAATVDPKKEASEVHSDSSEDDEDDDEEEETAVSQQEGEGETPETQLPDTVPQETTTPEVNPCQIVETLFNDTNKFKDACTLKYVTGKNYGWKCVTPSGDQKATGGVVTATGGLCIPPRRRRLYVKDLEKIGDGEVTQVQLREAFIKCAAVETFFLWDRYKKIKQKQKQEEQARESGSLFGTGGTFENSDEKTPETSLKSGNIPTDFLRQMFYTLGDYRDILFSGDKDEKSSTYNDILRGDKVIQEREEKIKEKIKIFFEQNGNKEGTPRVPEKSGQTTTKPESWWNNNGQHIWKGMVCALTHKTDKPEEVDKQVYKEFFGENNPGKPGTYTTQYDYKTVELKDEKSETQPKPTSAASSGDNNPPKTTLKNFVLRPPYFRYLEEWGETFCRQRTRMLAKIREECRSDNPGHEHCSGDGLNCKEKVPDNDKIFHDFNCQSCITPCRFYRKWIERKRIEFDKQNNAYGDQKEKAKNNKDYKQFCVTLETTCDTAAAFLNKLKSGPCSKTNNGDDDINFTNPNETFAPAANCDPCSKFKINCQNDNCRSGDGTNYKCDGKMDITAEDIKKINDSNNVFMLVSDSSKNEFEGNDLKEACEGKGIFTGIRKEQWKCRNVCGVHICKREKEGDEKYIIMKEFLKRWLEYFFEDYNRINKKLKTCIKKGDENKCINGCVEKWIEEKGKEWNNINDNYLQQYKNDDGNTLTNFLEQFQYRTEFKNAIKPCTKFDDFEKSKECAVAATTQNGKKRDVVECLLDKLEKEAKKCKSQPSANDCTTTPPDDEDLLLEEEQNPKNMRPGFCPPTPAETVVEEEKCEAAAPQPAPPSPSEGTEKLPSAPKSPEEQPEAEPPQKPTPPPHLSHPAVIPALVTSTLAWSVGIGFATFTYFYLKVLYIYMWMWMYMYFVDMYVWGVFGYIYKYIYVYVYVCVGMFGYIYVYMYVFYIYFIYIYLY